jgi:hypothetical protein
MGPTEIFLGLGSPATVHGWYAAMLRGCAYTVPAFAGAPIMGPAFGGLPGVVELENLVDTFFRDTQSPAEIAELPFFALDGIDHRASLLGGADGAIRQYLGECGAAGIVDFVRSDVFDEWGVAEADRDGELGLAMLGTFDIGGTYAAVTYLGRVRYLRERLDAEFGAGAYEVDPFVLEACGIFDPQADDATYADLVACVVP